jgi:hypothetical protein
MDRATVGFLSGLAGGMVTGTISLTLYMTGLCEICLVALGGGIFTQQLLPRSASLDWMILGFITNLILSGSLGVAIAFMLTYLGEKLAILKGAFFGSIVWYLLIGVFAPLAGYLPESPVLIDLFIILGYHIAFGGFVAFLIVKYGKTEAIT